MSDDSLPSMPDPRPEDHSPTPSPAESPTPPSSSRLPPSAPPVGADVSDLDRRRALAGDLLSIGAVSLKPDDPFTWSSGLRAPIYCDNRITLSFPRIRSSIRDDFVKIARSLDSSPDVIAGTATAGIPHAAWLASALQAPMVYVRSSSKSHGQENQIEGRLSADPHVLLVEDLISTGGSALQAASVLQAQGATVDAICAIFTYGLDLAEQAFRKAGIPLHTLTDFATLVDVARQQGDLSEADVASLMEWRQDPEAWSSAQSPPTTDP